MTDTDTDTVTTKPSFTLDVPEADIQLYVNTGRITIEFGRYPCHAHFTQSVKQCARINCDFATVCGQLSCDIFIRPRLEERRVVPIFNTRAECCVSH